MLARYGKAIDRKRPPRPGRGVALNCVANGKLQRAGIFDAIWIQPAAGDAGGALGAALAARHIWKGEERAPVKPGLDAMKGAYLGPEYDQGISIR